MKHRNYKIPSLYFLLLSCALLFLAVALHSWIATRLSFWGDETDTLAAPGYRPWRGVGGFWWQLQQYNANPPGEGLLLRLYYKSRVLEWLRLVSEELFWRLPHIFAYCASALIAFRGAAIWSGSVFLGFLVFCLMLISPGTFYYATEARFYIWAVMWMTAAVWQFLVVLEKEAELKDFIILSVILSLGVCFHLVLVPVAALFFCYSTALTVKRRFKNSTFIFLAGLIPLLVYQFFVKRKMYIPPTSPDVSVYDLIISGQWNYVLSLMQSGLPFREVWRSDGLRILTVALIIISLLQILRRNWARLLQGTLLLALVYGIPAALYISSGLRKYQLGERHMTFEVPLVLCAFVFLVKCFIGNINYKGWTQVLIVVLSVYVFSYTAKTISYLAKDMESLSPTKVNFPLVVWRNFYRILPDKRQLVVVGSPPNSVTTNTDLGTYNAGMLHRYVKEFSPVFYSVRGGFDKAEKLDPKLKQVIENGLNKFDFLVFTENPEKIQALLPNLPWKSWSCHTFGSIQNLQFCRSVKMK